MTWHKRYGLKTEYLSEEFNLLRPKFNRSVAGVLPELIRGLNISEPGDIIQDCVVNANIREKIHESFPSGYDNIVFFICDAVGVVHLEQLGGFLWDNINQKGTIATTMFPSMTSTVMTSLSFGKYPGDHGLVGYNIYNEHLGGVWNALNLQYKKNGEQRMVLEDVDRSKLVTGKPIIDRVNEATNFPVTFIGPSEYQGDPNLLDIINYSIPVSIYENPFEAGSKLVEALNQDHSNQLIAVYVPYADYAGHGYGPESEQYTQAIRGIEQGIQMIIQHPKVQNGSTIVAMTSDHGQSQVDHSISKWMDRNTAESHQKNGIHLSTSGRVLHAYCREDKIDQGAALLNQFADNKGLVIDKKEALSLAGGVNDYSARIGDHLMLMEDGYLFDIPEEVVFGQEIKLHGQHGSLSDKELYVPVGIFGGNN
ncbi:MAG: alkaline phosphatase family protein [Candidatus Kariarchaeaceae archaeon]|jgi:hypothetical protein